MVFIICVSATLLMFFKRFKPQLFLIIELLAMIEKVFNQFFDMGKFKVKEKGVILEGILISLLIGLMVMILSFI